MESYLDRTMIKTILSTISLILLTASSASAQLASWYGNEYAGNPVACASQLRRSRNPDIRRLAVFNPNQLTAAHRTLPCGTRVTVTNNRTGESVRVTITDRGPFVRGRVIDLSREAFRRIAPLSQGVVEVTVSR